MNLKYLGSGTELGRNVKVNSLGGKTELGHFLCGFKELGSKT